MRLYRVAAVSLLTLPVVVAPPLVMAETQRAECPKMQFVVVNSASDSQLESDADQGFLADVVSPVVSAANNDAKDVDYSAGFSASVEASESSSTESADSDSWKPDVWGKTTSSVPTTGTSSASAEPSEVMSTSSALSSSTARSASTSSPSVGRVYVNVKGVRQGAFIPGVHSESDPAWRDLLAENKDKVNAAVKQIAERCPGTKIAFVGENEGAAVVSEIARDIGAGQGVIGPEKVSGVAAFADPTRSQDQPTVASGADSPAAAPGTSGTYTQQVGSLNAKAAEGAGLATVAENASPGGYGQLENRTVSWCVDGDVRCSVPKAAPLTRLVEASNKNIDFSRDPEGSVRYVADVLGPSVALAGVETLAHDVKFGSNGFTFKRASSPEKTLIGRMAANTERKVDQSEMDQRLIAAGQQLGGMGLAAGITVAKKVLTPANIAQIAAAGAISPEAGALVVGVKLLEASSDLFTPETATTGALRLIDEASAGGVEVPEAAEAAVTTVVAQQVGQSAYKKQAVTKSGQTPTNATTQWLAALAADELGDAASEELITTATQAAASQEGVEFNQAAAASAVANL